MNNENNAHVLQVSLGSITADADVLAGYIPAHSKLKSFKIVNGAAIAQSDSDYGVLKLKIGAVELASHSTKLTGGNGALATDVLSDGTILSKDIPAGSKLVVNYDETGTYAMTGAYALIEWYPL